MEAKIAIRRHTWNKKNLTYICFIAWEISFVIDANLSFRISHVMRFQRFIGFWVFRFAFISIISQVSTGIGALRHFRWSIESFFVHYYYYCKTLNDRLKSQRQCCDAQGIQTRSFLSVCLEREMIYVEAKNEQKNGGISGYCHWTL